MFQSRDLQDTFHGIIGGIFANVFLVAAFCLIFVPINPIRAAENLDVFRAYQLELQGTKYGPSMAPLTCEVSTPTSRQFARKCLLVRLRDAALSVVKNAIQLNTGGIVILLPHANLDQLDRVSAQNLQDIEQSLVTESWDIPFYFAVQKQSQSNNNSMMYDEIAEHTLKHENAATATTIWNAIWSSGFRMSVDVGNSYVSKLNKMVSIESRLEATSPAEAKTIVFVAHMDSFAGVPGLAQGYDANASGVSILMMLARVFGRLYAQPETRGKYNLMFLLTNGGKFNFMGAEKYLRQAGKDSEELARLDSVEQVICLEGLSKNFESKLRMHTSRQPKEGTFSAQLLDQLQKVTSVELAHKKIVLNKDWLAWEHERFAIHRLPSLTLSTWPSHTQIQHRRSVLDHKTPEGPANVAQNARAIAEAVARIVYNVTGSEQASRVIPNEWISEASMRALLDMLMLESRSSNFLSTDHLTSLTAPLKKNSQVGVLQSIHKYLSDYSSSVRYLTYPWSEPSTTEASKQNKIMDETDAAAIQQLAPVYNVVFYTESGRATLTIYKLKSSVFDLFIGMCIAAYLFLVFLMAQNFEETLIWLHKQFSNSKLIVKQKLH